MGIFNEAVVKRGLNYLLRRYLSPILSHFSIEEFSWNAGKTSLENVVLNHEGLNELLKENNIPLEILHGSIAVVSITFVWKGLLTEPVYIDMKGLKVVAQPKERPLDVSMFESVLSSMASSRELAEDCLKNSEVEDEEIFKVPEKKEEGVHQLAQCIDTLFSNMILRLQNSSVKIEYVPENATSGIALEIRIANAEFQDEVGAKQSGSPEKNSDAFSFKKINLDGVSLLTSQFSLDERNTVIPDRTGPSIFIPGSPDMPPTHPSLPVKKVQTDVQDEPILISKMYGRQSVHLKIKQNEQVMGPKVSVEFNIGAFNLFLIPQQVHMLYELMHGLMKPCSSSDASCKQPSNLFNKPLKQSDFDLLGQEILRQQQNSDVPSKSLKIQQGWSSHSLDESDEDFQLMTTENRLLYNTYIPSKNDESMCSSVSSDTRSDFSGNCLGYNSRPFKHRGSTVQAMLQDQLSERTHFKGSCSSLCIIILHDDSVQESIGRSTEDSANPNNSQLSLKDKAERYFIGLQTLQMSGTDFNNFSDMREPLSSICATNHLRLMASSLTLTGNELASSAQTVMNVSLSLYHFEVLECLFNSARVQEEQLTTYVPVLVSMKTSSEDNSSIEASMESFKLCYQQTHYTSESRIKPPTNKLHIQLGDSLCELDISLIDRIQTLLNFPNTVFSTDIRNSTWHDSDVTSMTISSKITEFTISSPHLVVNLRFPVTDLRSIHDINRVPWWQQNLHKETFVMELKDVTFNTLFDGDESQSKYEIQCRDLHGLFKLTDDEEPISILRLSVDPDVDEDSQDRGFDWPRLVIRSTSKSSGGSLEDECIEETDLNMYSLADVLLANMDTELSPFRATSVAYNSKLQKNSPEKGEKDSMSLDHDEVIRAADKETMVRFIEEIVNKSKCLLEFFIPTVNIAFPSKNLFELFYNRLSNDLLLWERTISTPKTSYDPNGFRVHVPGLDFGSTNDSSYPPFQQFSNGNNSDPEDANEEESNFYSVYEYCQKQKEKHNKKCNPSSSVTKLSISFNITKGRLTFHTPVQDSSSNIVPNVDGILTLDVQDGLVFIASSYKGDPNESYFCITSEKSTLYHNEAVPQLLNMPIVEPLSSIKPSNMNCIIYATEQGMRLRSPTYDINKNNDMLKIAVHVIHNPDQLLKSFKVAIDISNATLRHYMKLMPQVWINQLIDFLKVADYPVNGYVPSAVVTEFHLNLSSCAIDYRPLHLPLRSAITVDNFNMSCNIAATTPTLLIRLISEEMRLFMSNNITAKRGDLKKNYVCVIDSGLIDVSFRTSVDEKVSKNESENNNPKLELCATNNIIHLRTCADSFKALVDLITYVCNSGDLESSDLENSEEMVEVKPLTSTVHQVDESHDVNALMEEALKDCPTILPQDSSEDLEKSADSIADLDDEFCILGDDPGVGVTPKNGEPIIRMLTDKPVQIVENYFSVPPGKSDVLEAPKNYPNPIVSLTLREMSLVWDLYGGSDFTLKGKEKTAKGNLTVTFEDSEKAVHIETSSQSVGFCKVTPMTEAFDSDNVHYSMEYLSLNPLPETDPLAWLKKGGPNRNHDVLMELVMNKVRFQRDIYPANEKYASRYVLLIYDIEIRDLLKSSKINKFLYQYSSQKIPRQSHANMIEVKATYTRLDPKLTSEECSLTISCKPLRLNVDQDSLFFLLDFFKEAFGIETEESDEDSDKSGENQSSKESSIPVRDKMTQSSVASRRSSITSSETFFRYFSFSPEVLIRIDYHGKHVIMNQGAFTGLLLGLTQLNASELMLKQLCYRHGLLGYRKVFSYATNEWKQDIMSSQLPRILGGVGPLNSFVQLFQGVKDFFYLPVAQYRKDGQIVRGLQDGALSFSNSALMATINLFSGIFTALEGTATVTSDIISPGPSVAGRYQRHSDSNHRTSQPADIREGIATALTIVREGFGDTARAIYSVASTEHAHKGVPGAVGGVLRQIPSTLFQPIILGSQATNCLLGAVRHQLEPDVHQEDIHKWRSNSKS